MNYGIEALNRLITKIDNMSIDEYNTLYAEAIHDIQSMSIMSPLTDEIVHYSTVISSSTALDPSKISGTAASVHVDFQLPVQKDIVYAYIGGR